LNHKKVYRIYTEEGLSVRKKKRRNFAVCPREPMPVPDKANDRWSLDFVSDALFSGRKFRTLNVIDDFSRECPAIKSDTSIPGLRVVRVLDRIALQRG
jgi:putative transposase